MAVLDPDRLISIGQERDFNPGDEIFCTGDIAHCAYLLKSGTVRFAAKRFDGTTVTFETISEGIFGEVAAFDGSARLASAFADGPVKVIEIDSESLWNLVDSDPAFRRMVIIQMGDRLQNSAKMLQKAAQASVDELTLVEQGRVAKIIDGVAQALGTVGFVAVLLVICAIWMAINSRMGDKAPDTGYVYLGLALGFISVAVTSIVLHSQNRNSKIMNKRKEVEFHTNLLAQRQIETLHTRLGEIEERLLRKL